MGTEEENTLTIEPYFSGGNGTATLTARWGGDTLTDKLDITSAKARDNFRERLVERWPAVSGAGIDRELEQIAAGHVSRQHEPLGNGVEVDVSRIIRAERFITSNVSGIAIPTLVLIVDKLLGRWQLYLMWGDGRREVRDLASSIDLPEGGKLWIYPQPGEPTPSMVHALGCWSSKDRQRWLDTGEGPAPADLFKRLCERIAHFIDLPATQAAGTTATLALWVILTYCYQAWDAVPYLYVGGPLGSGKSRIYEILSRLIFRPLTSSSLTGPALFRTLHSQGGALLFDEAERLKQPTPETGELVSMLLAGYKRGGQATRLEPVGDTFKTVAFDVFGPKALACITGLPPALSSRCIPISMFRAGPHSPKPRRRIDADPAGWQQLRDELFTLALNHGPTWLSLAARYDVCPPMSGRDYELWQPLMALAGWIESQGADGLLSLLQEHALATIAGGSEDQTPDSDETLLRTLADELRDGRTPTLGEILAKVKDSEPVTFNRWSAKGVASRLKNYKVVTHKSCGRKIYGREMLDVLRRVQANYSVDLELPDPSLENVPQCALRAPTDLLAEDNTGG